MVTTPQAFPLRSTRAAPEWLDSGDNAWQLTAATLVGLQTVPGLVILYSGLVKRIWAGSSAFMALYAFAVTLLCWVTWAYKMSFGEQFIPILGVPGPSLGYEFLLGQAKLPSTVHYYKNGTVAMKAVQAAYGMSNMVMFQFCFSAITVVLLAGSLFGRMSFRAWILFVPLWITFSYTVGAFSVWGGGFLWQWGVIDYAGGYVIHVSSGISGFVAAFWSIINPYTGNGTGNWPLFALLPGCRPVGERKPADREYFPPYSVFLVLVGAGLLWMGWSGFNGGAVYSSNLIAGLAVLNTHICTVTSLLTWTALDMINSESRQPSLIGAVHGMMTGLVTITPAAGFVAGWAALAMGFLSAAMTWWVMVKLYKSCTCLHAVDDTLGVFYTHAVAGIVGGLGVGVFAAPELCTYMNHVVPNSNGLVYGGNGGMQVVKQLVGVLFIIGWNAVVTTLILLAIKHVLRVPLRFSDDQLNRGDDAVLHERYALWGDAEMFAANQNGHHRHADVEAAAEADEISR